MSQISEGLAWLLARYYDFWPWQNGKYGMAVVILTLTVMILVVPLTYKGTKSMIAMQRLQPEIQRVRAEFKDDPQQMNQEMVELYQRHGVNPLGCMTQFIQIPIFLALYQVILGLTRRLSETGKAVGQAAPYAPAQGGDLVPPPLTEEARTFNPAYLSEDEAMREDLLNSTEMRSFGFDLADSAWDVLGRSVVDAIPYLLMIAIVALSGWYQQRQIMARNPGAERNPQQVMISRVMLIFLPVISFRLQAAVVLYFVVSNLFRVGQQWFITRSLYAEEANRLPVIDTEPVAEKTNTKSESASTNTAIEAKPAAPEKSGSSGGSTRHGSRRPTSKSKPKRSGQPNRNSPKPSKPGAGPGRVTPKGQGQDKKKR